MCQNIIVERSQVTGGLGIQKGVDFRLVALRERFYFIHYDVVRGNPAQEL